MDCIFRMVDFNGIYVYTLDTQSHRSPEVRYDWTAPKTYRSSSPEKPEFRYSPGRLGINVG